MLGLFLRFVVLFVGEGVGLMVVFVFDWFRCVVFGVWLSLMEVVFLYWLYWICLCKGFDVDVDELFLVVVVVRVSVFFV